MNSNACLQTLTGITYTGAYAKPDIHILLPHAGLSTLLSYTVKNGVLWDTLSFTH